MLMLTITYKKESLYHRNWRKHLKSVKDQKDQLQIYQTLHLLMDEENPDNFVSMTESFLELWEKKEPEFTKYFKDTYVSRAGAFNKITIDQVMTLCSLSTHRKVGKML